jgi:hypothetical protein
MPRQKRLRADGAQTQLLAQMSSIGIPQAKLARLLNIIHDNQSECCDFLEFAAGATDGVRRALRQVASDDTRSL